MTAPKAPSVTKENGVTVVALGPDYENLNDQELEDLKTMLFEVVATSEPPLVVLDLSHTRFFGSSFIEVLFRSWNAMNARPGGRFTLSGLSTYCREVIEVTHLDQLWTLFDSREQAVEALGRA